MFSAHMRVYQPHINVYDYGLECCSGGRGVVASVKASEAPLHTKETLSVRKYGGQCRK